MVLSHILLRLIFFGVAIAACGSCFALDFKGIELGEPVSMKRMHQVASVSCSSATAVVGGMEQSCVGYTTIAGMNAKISIGLWAGNIVRIIGLTLPSEKYQAVEDALIVRYGQPIRERLPNGMEMAPRWHFSDGSWIQASDSDLFYPGMAQIDFMAGKVEAASPNEDL